MVGGREVASYLGSIDLLNCVVKWGGRWVVGR